MTKRITALKTNGGEKPSHVLLSQTLQFIKMSWQEANSLMSRMYFLVIDHFLCKLRKSTFTEADDLLKTL